MIYPGLVCVWRVIKPIPFEKYLQLTENKQTMNTETPLGFLSVYLGVDTSIDKNNILLKRAIEVADETNFNPHPKTVYQAKKMQIFIDNVHRVYYKKTNL